MKNVRRPRVRIVDDGPVGAQLELVARMAGYLVANARPDVILLNLGSRARMQLMQDGNAFGNVPIVVLAPLGELSHDFAWLRAARILPLPFHAPSVIGALDNCTRDRTRVPVMAHLARLVARSHAPAPSGAELHGAHLSVSPELLERAILLIRATLALADAERPGRADRVGRSRVVDAWTTLGTELVAEKARQDDRASTAADALALVGLLSRRLELPSDPVDIRQPARTELVEACRRALLHGMVLHESARAAQFAVMSSWCISEITRAQEEERRHLAAELHDEVTQLLAHVSLAIDGAAAKVRGGTLRPGDLDDTALLTRDLLRRVRTSASELQPPILDDLGLAPALNWLVTRMRDRTGMSIALHLPERIARLSEREEVAAFRIVQEALQNVEKHAGANCVRVSVALNADELWLEVTDDGRGFQPADELDRSGSAHLGIGGMKYRARLLGGECHLENTGRGTRVSARLPLEHHIGVSRIRPRARIS